MTTERILAGVRRALAGRRPRRSRHVFGYRVLDRFSPVEWGPKWTGPSGELRRSEVAPCADCRLGGPVFAVWERSVCPVGVPCKRVRRGRPRSSGRREAPRVFFGGGAANGARGRHRRCDCGGRLVAFPWVRRRDPRVAGAGGCGGFGVRGVRTGARDGRACPRQEGGGRARASGTTGSGAHSIVVINERGSRLRWRAVRTTLASTCWVSAPRRVRLPPQTLRVTTAGRMACSARQLVASIDGSHKKRNTAGNSLAKCLAKRSASANGAGASIQPAEPGGESTAGRRQTVLTDFARVAAGPQGEAVPQDRLHRSRPGAVGMSCLQVLAPSEQVRLMPISGLCRCPP